MLFRWRATLKNYLSLFFNKIMIIFISNALVIVIGYYLVLQKPLLHYSDLYHKFGKLEQQKVKLVKTKSLTKPLASKLLPTTKIFIPDINWQIKALHQLADQHGIKNITMTTNDPLATVSPVNQFISTVGIKVSASLSLKQLLAFLKAVTRYHHPWLFSKLSLQYHEDNKQYQLDVKLYAVASSCDKKNNQKMELKPESPYQLLNHQLSFKSQKNQSLSIKRLFIDQSVKELRMVGYICHQHHRLAFVEGSQGVIKAVVKNQFIGKENNPVIAIKANQLVLAK